MSDDGRIRLSRLLSERGLCSRREADHYIERGWVFVDGQRVTELGTKAFPHQDVRLDPRAARAQNARVTILLHKPVGYVSSQAEKGYAPAATLIRPETRFSGDRSALAFSADHARGLAPAGRLDIDSTGLLILTQDGRVAKQIIGEDSDVEKEYLVRVRGDVTEQALRSLRHGLSLDGEALRPARVFRQNQDQLRFILKQGKKRQIRRMCELVGLTVSGLKRVRIGSILLGDLPPGQWRYLAPGESILRPAPRPDRAAPATRNRWRS